MIKHNKTAECMSFTEFQAALKRYFEIRRSIRKGVNRYLALHKCDEMLDEISYSFDDEYENIKRWLYGIRCRYYHPATGNEIDIPIGNDIEAIYDFLKFIYKLKNHMEIEDFELYNLSLEITRSNSPIPWEEC